MGARPRGAGGSPAVRGRRPGGTDVARLAGVSQKTVSRVMNNEPRVSPEVRQRVLQAAQELGYRRNNAARALNSGRTQRIGVVSLGTALFGPSSLLVALERCARDTGYALSIVNTFEGDPAGIAGAIESLLEEGVDGIVVSEPIDEGTTAISVDVPVLTLGRFPALDAARVVATGAGADRSTLHATQHLLDLGHRTVHHLAGPQQWWSARDRLEGWRLALDAAGAPEPPFLEGDWTPASGYAAGVRLAADPMVTAVLAANDDMAIGLIRALHDAGLSVPDDVSVVGYDDIPVAAFTHPPLTTVKQEFEAVARSGFAELVRAIEDPQHRVAEPDPLPVSFVQRASTAPPPASRREPAAGPPSQD